jgi:hypothetical protein
VHDGDDGEHGMASATVGHDDPHNELFAFAVQSLGCGLGHDGSLGFIVQKPPLPTSFAPPMPLFVPPNLVA